jgi:hypothetical protein
MACTREEVMQALFAKVSPLQAPADSASPLPAETPFRTVARRTTMPGQGFASLDPSLMPALTQWEDWPEETVGGELGLRKRTWEVWMVIQFRNDDRLAPGATILNPLIDAVEAALSPDSPPRQVLTLDGLVNAVYIDGPTIKNTGDTDAEGNGRASVPVKILVP